MSDERPDEAWHQTACILCSINCGIEVKLDGRRFARIRGDKTHPTSQGYTCEKALRLDHYQASRDRITSPLRRRPDGTFEEIDWDTAIAEVAQRLAEVRDQHGGERILYYGGGGQGNHLGGGYSGAVRAALGMRYSSNALAQEKTGEFWVDSQLFGKPQCHTTGDYERAEVAVFLGKNPWQSHGFPRARPIVKEIARDPDRCLIVIDPRRTETAELADIHLRLRPGTDAWCLSALVAILFEEDLLDHAFLAEHASGLEELGALAADIDIARSAAICGLDEEQLRTTARRLAAASSVSIFEDLGIQQAPHSTLSSWLEKLVFLLTGNFGKPGAMNLHTGFAQLFGRSTATPPTPVGGHRILAGLVPSAVIPDEILTDHPDRFRAMLIESSNPAHSLPDSARWREALRALDLVVVIDVALTETAREADYVLPAATQFEKWECTFFTLEFPENAFQLRRPLLEPTPGTLPEPEIHTRLVRALGALDDEAIAPLRAAAAAGRAEFTDAFMAAMLTQPEMAKMAPVVLYETLGPTLPEGARAAAAVWGLSQIAALTYPESVRRAGHADGNALFDAIMASPQGVVFSVDPYEETWNRMETPDKRIRLVVQDLVPELASLATEDPRVADPEFPFVLSAGERRSSTANTAYRDPSWRKRDTAGALRIHPDDAAAVGVGDGGTVRVVTRTGAAEVPVELTDAMYPGHVSLPNGFGLDYPDESGVRVRHGVAPNELTSVEDRDAFAGTPLHKHVRARLEAVAPAGVEVPA
ncbi:MAG: molybdopterin-dependent oxidoreductase [Acidimicrobiales bacterium]